ncbi:MAG: type II secretion system protein GspJ [Thermodesulfobacteriota bacterium]
MEKLKWAGRERGRARLQTVYNEKGFTLLEILLAASIMSALFVGLYVTFFSVTGAQARIEGTLESTRQIRRFMDVMATEARSSFYRDESARTRFEGEFFERRGRAMSKVTFTWFSYPQARAGASAGSGSGPMRRPASELMAVSYFFDDPSAGADGKEDNDRAGVLYKARWSPYDDVESGYKAEVMENVESFLLTYFTGKEWVKSWDASKEKRLPGAIKIELALREGEDNIKHYSTIIRTAMGNL